MVARHDMAFRESYAEALASRRAERTFVLSLVSMELETRSPTFSRLLPPSPTSSLARLLSSSLPPSLSLTPLLSPSPKVAVNGMALESAAEELRADREVVLAAVTQNGEALQCTRAPSNLH